MTSRVTLFVSVDTEEDNYLPARNGITVENARELPRLESFFEKLGVRASYLVTYQVASQGWAAEILRGISENGRSEVGAHLHPWNTPPAGREGDQNVTMTGNLSPDLQLEKLQRLTHELERAVGCRPVSFRAGRYGLGRATVQALIRSGYSVDSSVTPFISWTTSGNGPDFRKVPLHCYTLDGEGDVREPTSQGPLVEVPLTVGFHKRPYGLWSRVDGVLSFRVFRPMRALGIAKRLGVPTKIVLSPELNSASEMVALSSQLIRQGVKHLQLFLHSPSLLPGLTPYVTTRNDVDRLYGSIDSYLEGLTGIAQVDFATLRAAPALLAERSGSLASHRSGKASGD